MAISRQTPELLSATIARVRLILGDRSSQTAIQRYSDADILGVVNDALVMLQTMASGVQMGKALVPSSVTYTGGADEVNLGTFGTDITLEGIGHVEDVTSSTLPVPLEYVVPSVLEDFRSTIATTPHTRRVWTLIASATNQQIRVRPIPAANTTLRIWSLAPAFVAAASSDTFPLAARWQELTALEAAKALGSVEEEWNQQLEERRLEAKQAYIDFGQGQKRGLRMLPVRRTGRS